MEQVYTEEELEQIEYIRNKKKKGIALTPEEIMSDFERQLKPGDKRIYPTTLGVTGTTFRSGKIVWANKIQSLADYMPSIDNLAVNVKDVRSLMVVPVFGHEGLKPIAIV